jgi:hypothetical protein
MNSNLHNQARWMRPGGLVLGSTAAIFAGAIGLGAAFARDPKQGWTWLVVDFVLFWGIASGMLVWAAAFRTAQATWTPVINRLAHSAITTAPFLFALLIALVAGLRGYAPWAEHPVRGKEAWLNVPSFALREIIAGVLFYIACLLLVRWSLNADTQTEITEADARRLNAISVVAIALFAVTSSLVAWDFVMSLSPKWVSTMFSVYYFCTNAYAGMAVLILMAAALRRPLGLEDRLKPSHFHDMGNLLLAFSLFDMGLFFAQYVTIWYENLPEEVWYLILRYDKGIWPPIGWTSFVLGYAIPFLLLQSRTIKLNPKLLSIVAVIALVGVGIERYVLVVPSVAPRQLFIAPIGALSVLGFAGALVLVIGRFMQRYSPVSKADEVLEK